MYSLGNAGRCDWHRIEAVRGRGDWGRGKWQGEEDVIPGCGATVMKVVRE